MIKKPDWLRVPYFDDRGSAFVTGLLEELKLHTVCIEANCPNRSECFSNKTAAFMILGTNCTRNCSFCNVNYGAPQPVDTDEPSRIADAVKRLELQYTVITSVTRDDLPDGGAAQFSNVISAIRNTSPDTVIEVLIPDSITLKIVTDESPDVISHNIETVESLYADIRPDADYHRSLDIIRSVKKLNPDIHSKSGLMLGLGETAEEIVKTFDDLLDAGCEFLTIGQYLSPSKKHYRVREYIEPKIFDEYAVTARKKGFRHVASAPFVRSSYHAKNALLE